MVFKRRDRRSFWRAIVEAVYPRGGWRRAFEYVKHRLRRLPDTPERISRGLAAGVFVAWTPFYGLHFLVAAAIAFMVRGNIVSSLLGTFFGNPLTFVPIGVLSMKIGHIMLGRSPERVTEHGFGEAFGGAAHDLSRNLMAVISPAPTDWHGLWVFYDSVFLPFLVGGIIPGLISAAVSYVIALPLIRAYQNTRRKRLQSKLSRLGPDIGAGDKRVRRR